MAAKKVTAGNHKPGTGDGRFRVYSKQFNELVDVVNDTISSDGVLQADTISEETSGAGVTADGVLLKDGAVTPANGVVTQITSISTGVTLNQPSGVITTVTATTAALSVSTFTVLNSFATTTSNIQCTLISYSGTNLTNGLPLVSYVDNRTDGSFDIVIYNAHASNALNGILQIAFVIFK
jgi:hypothetical protein